MTPASVRPDSSIQWTAYPALVVAGAFAAGIVAASALETTSLLGWLVGASAGVGLFFVVQWWDRRRLVTLAPLGRIVAVVLVAGCAGGARSTVYQSPSPRSLAPAADASDNATVRGVVADAPEHTEDATRFVLAVDSVLGRQDTAAVDGRARATLRSSPWAEESEPFPFIRQGDVLRLHGALRSAPGLRNPGGFDYEAYLARRGICCTLYVNAPDQVAVVGHERGFVQNALVSVRAHLRRQVARYISTSGSEAVLRALLLGDRSRITDAQRDRFEKTGLMHLLAVSGLHVFLVGMVLYALLRPVLMRFRLRWRTVEVVRAVLTVAVLGFYMLLTGSRPSVVRAVIMASLFIGGVLVQRSAHSLNTLGVAALFLLAMRPPMLFDVGFQLSMAAVAGIVTLNPRFREAVPEAWKEAELANWLVSTTTVSAAAILATGPILLYHFGWVSVAGLLLNMAGIPCTGLALASAIVMGALGSLWPAGAASFGSVADLFVQGLLATSQYGATWFSWAGFRMPVPDFWKLGAFGAGLVALAQWPRPRVRWRWIAGGLLLATVSVWSPLVEGESPPHLDVIFFDVGQGDAALLRMSSGHQVLVDTGPRSPSSAAVEFSVLPFLERWGIWKLDLVVVSHSDEDHLGGLPALLEEITVDRLVHNGRPVETELYLQTRRLLREKKVSTRGIHRGDTLDVSPDLQIDVLGPPSEKRTFRKENDASVVLRVRYGKVNALMPGDVEATAEQDLVQAYGSRLASRIVKVPHHGSETSSTPAFVRASSLPGKTRAVVSVGRNDQYRMPSEDVVRRWGRHAQKVYSTAHEGAVWMRTDGQKVWQVRWK